MATYLITGGAGFIGSHLAERLIARGDRLRVLDSLTTGRQTNLPAGTDLVQADIRDAAVVAKAMRGVDGVFHLAAVSSVHAYLDGWSAAAGVNAVGSLTVFEAAARAQVALVYASSAAVYGNPAELPLTETAPLRPISGYGADKLGNELHAAAMAEAKGLAAVGLRFFNVYGPRQSPDSAYSGVISIFLNRWRSGRPLTVFGDGSQTRDFIFVQDVARALVAAMDRAQGGGGGTFNICTGRATSILDLVAALAQVVQSPLDVDFAPPRSGEISASLGSPEAAAAALDFRAQTEFVAGLAETLAWVRATAPDRPSDQIPDTKPPANARQETTA